MILFSLEVVSHMTTILYVRARGPH